MEEPGMGAVVGQRAAGRASVGAGTEDPNAVYALGSSSGESARLQRQADELAPDSIALLDRVGLRPGDSAIDFGCGPRGVLELLSERVSPGGRVVGLDADQAHVAMATELVHKLGLSEVEIVRADARRTGLKSGSFDLVHARTLLVTVPEPATVLAEMVRLARSSGWVAGLEPDTEYAMCYPPKSVRTSIPLGIRAGRSGLTWSAACVLRSWRWGWPMNASSTSLTRLCAGTSMTPTPW